MPVNHQRLVVITLFGALLIVSLIRNIAFEWPTAEDEFGEFRKCMDEALRAQVPNPLVEKCKKCEALLPSMRIKSFRNLDEPKFHVIPSAEIRESTKCVIVSLGVGRDVTAEKKLRAKQANCRFFGVDPIVSPNEKLYRSIARTAKFFPFAVGNETGTKVASVPAGNDTFAYKTQHVMHVEFGPFLQMFVNESVIDNMWMDAEGAEYGLLNHFSPGGDLDRRGITVCQWNIEIHGVSSSEDNKNLGLNFLRRSILQERRWICSRLDYTYHIRTYCFNYESPVCRRRLGLDED